MKHRGPRRALVMVGMVSLAVLTVTGAVRAAQGPLEARLPSGVTITR